MKVKNISKGILYLESGELAPGAVSEATDEEYSLLFRNSRIELPLAKVTEVVPKKPVAKKAQVKSAAKPKAAANG